MIDPRTGRRHGDHGSAAQALAYALDRLAAAGRDTQIDFLYAWSDGSAADGWPEYYDWLEANDRPFGLPGVGRTTLGGGDRA